VGDVVLFVHGTGVRERAWAESFAVVKQRLLDLDPSTRVSGCFWGGSEGAQFNAGGASIPSYRTGGDDPSEAEENLALWAVLYIDPWYEIGLLGNWPADRGQLALGQVAPSDRLREQIETFVPSEELSQLLARYDLGASFDSACAALRAAPEFDRTVATVTDATLNEYRKAVARALVAFTTVRAEDSGAPPIDGAAREEIVTAIIDDLYGSGPGVAAWLTRPFKGIAQSMVTQPMAGRRGALTDATSPTDGDIMHYQVRGSGIRRYIRQGVADIVATDPGSSVTLLAHSLGGIACVDALIEAPIPGVGRLVTVGSQAPFFYEIDALTSLSYGEPLPDHFPAWLNIYDDRDLLSFIGADLFPGRVTDLQVDNGQPFPQAHSAYWRNDAMWRHIGEFLGNGAGGQHDADPYPDYGVSPAPPPPPPPPPGGTAGEPYDESPDGGGDGNGVPPPMEDAEQPAGRLFVAELEGHPASQPVKMDEQYTIAFSVVSSSATAIAMSPFPDELLAEAYKDSEVLELTVQLDSDDFEIFSDSTQRLGVPRTGRSRGKARFDIAPRHNGRCQLVASVHYNGNFVHQMKVTITVGGDGQVAVEVSARGRPPDAAVALEPRDISIILEPATPRGFMCTTLESVGTRVLLPISATELAAAVEQARKAMMEVIGWPSVGEKVFQTRIDISAEARDMALRTLARAGAHLFQRLFLHPATGADAKQAGYWLRDNAMDPGVRLKVQIVADQAPLPWAMLYLGDAAEGAELDWNYFLGMRHIVEQLPLQQSMSTRDSRIPSRPKLAVSVNVNRSIDKPAKGLTLVAGHQKHWTDTAAARAGLTLVSRTTKTEVVRALANASTGDQVVYFYCHATASAQNSQDPDTAEIIMGTNDRATLAELYLDAPTDVQLPGNPLVFINACESADLSPLFYNGFVPYFMAKGARGVIGTECKTPALFAVEWANAFFDRFLDGAPLGETVLQLRREFLRAHGNPLGLIYAVHCAANTRIVPALARAEAG